tara:strand:+ start:10612 stop:11580 length:969 start_codon:yes stop_codon:yes gene_type:complete
MKFALLSLSVLGILILLGYLSGNEPARDAVAHATNSLGIPIEQDMVKVGDVSLNVVFAGPLNGKPVVLLHGFPEFWYAWRDVMAELAKAGYRVIVPDQRGYNSSEKPSNSNAYSLDKLAGDVSGLIKVLGYEHVFLAGHDFGGLVAWWTLALYPDQIERFVVINKPHPQAIKEFEGSNPSISWYRQFLRVPYLPGYLSRLANWYLLSSNLRATSMPNTFPEEHMNQFRSAWDNEGAINSMGAWYRANANFEMPIDSKISVPGLFILAPNDAFSPVEMGRKSLDYMVNGQIIELEEGTHWVIQEKPKLIAQLLMQQFRPKVDE